MHPSHLPGGAAAALLGVKRETLYAYVSRGLVRSVAAAGRARLYLREDLERLKAKSEARSGHGPVAAGALRWGEAVLSSSVTRIDAAGPSYRGRPAVELARAHVPFESVAELLWSGQLPDAPPRWSLPPDRRRARERRFPTSGSLLDRMALTIVTRGVSDPRRFGAPPGLELEIARQLVPRLVVDLGALRGAATARRASREAPLAGRVAIALGGSAEPSSLSPARLGAIDAALVLSADHELNASAFAGRIAASAGADLYACLTAAMATLSGSRHGGACDRIDALIDEVATPRRARAVIEARLKRGEAIPGFGHPLYPRGDPRAAPLIEAARRHGHGRPRLKVAEAIARAMGAAGREPPALDLGLVSLAAGLGLCRGAAAALFALGRVAGWVAHIAEQRRDPSLLRPRARYVDEVGDTP